MLTFPDDLPITGRLDEIARAIREHQVVVVAGETGSGKTTQLPKLCLREGRGKRRRIAHTQPRRLAARSIADRLAEETQTKPGTLVGSRIRFADRTSKDTRVVLMTDGILLAEIGRDRLLRRYDTIILDEAHERSLNIDFLLGYLATLLPRRPDLKVIITSATIDPGRFAEHFSQTLGTPVPVIEVSGRTYPVEVRYRPFGPGHDDGPVERDQTQAILDGVDELAAEPDGDVLVFLSGEREIRDTAEALRGHLGDRVEILPLYARLSHAEQRRVFASRGPRRIVLATNVAETSLTVPGIRYVIDAGTARISRYSLRTKVQRLPIEPVSQASADQRKGRCGRLADGICLRLYSQEDFDSRPRFTDAEILRTNLAAVILQMAALGLGEVEGFPFLDPPDRRNLRDGVQLLEELGALDPSTSDPQRRLTEIGRRLARLPVDPRLGRMILAADSRGCVQEVLVIAAALSIQDPRERPEDHREAAAQAHARFRDPTSDLIGYLNLWSYLQERQRELSGSKFRRMCRDEYLHFLRIREWQDLVTQLRQACREISIQVPERPDLSPTGGSRAAGDVVHQAVLPGLLSHIGIWDPESRDYLGARNARFAINPGSALAKKPPRWVMAGELVETSRVWARDVARIDPGWVEPVAKHLVRRSYSEPHWERRRGAVVATEKVTLYGLPVVAGRPVNFARIDPALCRELFIRHALVEGDWDSRHAFLQANRQLLAEVADLEDKSRRRDVAVDDEAVFALYDARIPESVVSARHFDAWWKKARAKDPDLLTFSRDEVVRADATDVDVDAFPEVWVADDLTFPLTYRFEPGAAEDGVTVQVPVAVLPRVDADAFTWQVPGLRAELVTALLRSLPKGLRRSFVPAPDYAGTVLDRLRAGQGRLDEQVALELTRFGGPVVSASDFDLTRVPPHLRMRFVVVDDQDRQVAVGEDLAVLRERLAPDSSVAVADAVASHEPVAGVERRGVTAASLGVLPRRVDVQRTSGAVTGFPTLLDAGDRVDVRVLASEAEQAREMPLGTRRLLLAEVPSPVRSIRRSLDPATALSLSHSPYGSVEGLLEDCVACAVDDLVVKAGGPAWDEARFVQLVGQVRASLPVAATDVTQQVGKVLAVARKVDGEMAGLRSAATESAKHDLEVQLEGLLYEGFVSATGRDRLGDLHRYLRAILRRIEDLGSDVDRDAARMAKVHALEDEYLAAVDALPREQAADPSVVRVRWLLEEFRVSQFAQRLGTREPVSEKRIRTALAALRPR